MAFDIQLSRFARGMAPSATMAVADKARRLRESGVKVIAFAAGMPDFDTPQHIKDAAAAALAAGDTKYTSPVSGITPLRQAICDYTREYMGLEYGPEHVCVTPGGKDALHLAFRALLDEGDEAIIPAPYWVSFPEQVKMCGATPVIVSGDVERGGKLGPAKLAAAITPKTKIIVLNSPSNPAGFTYTRAETEALADVIRPSNAIIFSDDIYHRLIYSGEPFTSIATFDGFRDRTVLFNSASKTYAMTGWRLGWMIGPEPIVKAAAKFQSQTTSGAVSFVQTASMTALTGDQSHVEEMRSAYARRCEIMYSGLNRIAGIQCVRPTGAFYAFADVSGTFDKLGVSDSGGFAEAILEQAHVAIVPGGAFGWDTHARFTYATSDDAIEEGLARLGRLLGTA
jgi:aspartate aminotransferase